MLNNKKENKRLPMPGKIKKGFRCYCTLVMAAALLGCCSMTAFAANDPWRWSTICRSSFLV